MSKYEAVTCAFHQSCVLPCSFEPGPDPVIHWIKEPHETTPVHSYYYNQNQLQDQPQNYTGRTSLFEKQLSTGNASLLLSEVKGQDAGRYKCYVNTKKNYEKVSYVNFKFHAPVLSVSLQKQDEKLVCRSENIYPKPSVSWSLSPESVDKPQTFINPSADGLWSVLSSVSLPDSLPHEYICNVSTTHSWRSATYRRQHKYIDLLHDVEIPCTEPKAPVKSLIWKFNHNQTILNQSRPEPVVYNESWRHFVDGVTQSNYSLVLKDLSANREGLFSCEISTDTGEIFIHTEVTDREKHWSYIQLLIAAICLPWHFVSCPA
ncbi:hypothetical protein WMY93_031733 [Mugilogobius chulae]|uniref:Ig-like domain-containing protein n=1 Tax=Mugilogobius chulae TaxID=88201 RepID=A0AAW0ME11_9GOBI